MTQQLEIHPLAEILPAMNQDQFDELKESIDRNGLRRPIVTLGNKILSGRHRYKACVELGIQPSIRSYDPQKDGPVPIQYILDEDINRRHLTTDQRAVTCAKLWEQQQKDIESGHQEPINNPEPQQPEADTTEAPEPTDTPNPTEGAEPPEDGDVPPRPATGQTEQEEEGHGAENAKKALMQKLGIGESKMKQALWVQKRDPDMIERIAAGELTLDEARKRIEMRESASQYRKETADILAADMGDDFAEQIRNCEVLTPDKQLKAFVAAPVPDRQNILDLMKMHDLTCIEACKWVAAAWGPKDSIGDMLTWAKDILQEKNKATFSLDGCKITIVKPKAKP